MWEVKDPLLAGGDYGEEDTASNYHGGPAASLVGGVSGKQLYQNVGPGARGYPPPMERY